jgi:hypothetical protein
MIQDWTSRWALWTGGLLLFETVTGLAIYLGPFSTATQVAVLVHTLAGIVLLPPAAVYLLRHLLAYWPHRMSHSKLTGYLAAAALLVLAVSGVVLTWQAALGTRISYGWRTLHIGATFALVGFALPHVGLLLLRARRTGLGQGARRYVLVSTAITAGLGLAWAAWSVLERPAAFKNELPADYSMPYGDDRPFAPSLARTASGGAYDAASLSGSESCGSAGCHSQIYEEWLPSAHRYAAMDPPFQAIQQTMAQQNGAESTRYCGGCHDPISLFSGTKNIFVDDLTGLAGYQEGVSCIACHSIRETDVKGNAAYVIVQPERYLRELDPSPAGKAISDFLIRAYPDQHVATYSRRMFKTAEFCAACHKQFIDQEVNNVGWVQLQNQYDNWRKSHWNHPGDPQRTIECRECHMPLSASSDPASGDTLDYNRSAGDGRHRSHRFLGANQWLPTLLELPGGQEHVRLTEQWLRGELRIPEIEHKWRDGPAVPIEILAPAQALPGAPIEVQVVITSNKVGHDFPTGPLDIIQAWVELEVLDPSGAIVFASGRVDEKNFIEPGTFLFKAEPVDQYGNLIDRHNLWEMVGVRYRRSLFPGFADTAQFSFACPSAVPGPAAEKPEGPRVESFAFPASAAEGTELSVRARLRYRKIDQFLLNFTLGEDKGLTSPITTLSEAAATIRVAAVPPV